MISLASLTLAACATPSVSASDPVAAPHSPPLAYAAIGETVYVDGPRVTPLAVLEDSRCSEKVQCVWAGRLRINARIHLGSGDETREMTMGKPIAVADGSLELDQVLPDKRSADAPAPAGYRFGFRFMGGL